MSDRIQVVFDVESDEEGNLVEVRPTPRRSRSTDGKRRVRNRKRVEGSWRDQGKGECFTRTNKNGGKYTVCNDPPRGSRGQQGVDRSRKDRGDEDIKGRDKSAAIDKARPVMKKYKEGGEVEGQGKYFTPLKKEGGNVILIKWRGKSDPIEKLGFDGYTGADLGKGEKRYTNAEIEEIISKGDTISIPLSEFNAQYRVSRARDGDIGGSADALEAGEYELGEGVKQVSVGAIKPKKKGRAKKKVQKKLKKRIEVDDKEIIDRLGRDLIRKNIDLYLKIRGFKNYADFVEGRGSQISPEKQAVKARNYYRVEALRKIEGKEALVKKDRRLVEPVGGARRGTRQQGVAGTRQQTILDYERDVRARRVARAGTVGAMSGRNVERAQQQRAAVRVMFEGDDIERENLLRLANEYGLYDRRPYPIRVGGEGVDALEFRNIRRLIKEDPLIKDDAERGNLTAAQRDLVNRIIGGERGEF